MVLNLLSTSIKNAYGTKAYIERAVLEVNSVVVGGGVVISKVLAISVEAEI